jgi:hypothetical protein
MKHAKTKYLKYAGHVLLHAEYTWKYAGYGMQYAEYAE